MMDNFINVIQSKKSGKYYDIRDKRLPDFDATNNKVLYLQDGQITFLDVAQDIDYDQLIEG